MTLKEIIMKYDKDKNKGYHKDSEDYYNDMRKKLQRAFECLGVYDMSIFKNRVSGEYSFPSEEISYIFALFEKEQSPLFKRIRDRKMKEEDYFDYTEEIEELFCFLEKCDLSKDRKNVIDEISSNIRYPILRRFADNQISYHTLLQCYSMLLFDEDYMAKIINWQYLLANDKIMLLDELIEITKKWIQLTNAVANCRANEHLEHLDRIDIYKAKLYLLVEAAIENEYNNLSKKDANSSLDKKPRSFSAEYNKSQKQAANNAEKKLLLAQQFCEKYNLDFEQYLAERSILEKEYDYPKESSAVLLKKCKQSLTQ